MRPPRLPSFPVRVAAAAAVSAALLVLVLAAPAGAQNRTLDEQTFREFEQIVADFTTAERIQAWEAFLLKYPSSSFVPQVKRIIAELRGGGRPAPRPTPDPGTIPGSGGDPDLDFLDEPAPAEPPPRPRRTPMPVATPTPAPPNPFMDAGTGRPRPSTTASASRFDWDNPSGSSSSGSSVDNLSRRRTAAVRPPPTRRPPRTGGVGKATHTEVAFIAGFAPDEEYVRNVLFGMTAAQRFGRTWGVSVEAFGASNSETPLLRSLRNIGAEPEVISKYNFLAGATAEANVLSAIDAVTGQIPNRNDVYVRAGGGIVNTDLEICKEEGGQECAAPLFIQGVNFGYATAGIGHRFYFTPWLTFRSEVRGRIVLELIDGKTSPRSNIQINVGPTVVF